MLLENLARVGYVDVGAKASADGGYPSKRAPNPGTNLNEERADSP